MVIDLCNPSPDLGWENKERESFLKRAKDFDLTLSLALVHHLAIGNNVPFSKVAQLFFNAGKNLIIEYIDKEDSQIKKLLANRKDVFTNYTQENFEESFSKMFNIIEKRPINNTYRTLYLMRRKEL